MHRGQRAFRSALSIAVLLGSWTSGPAAETAPRPGPVLEEFVYETSPFASSHAATILELPDGTLLCAFFGGTAEGDPDVEIRLARKPPGGGWTVPVNVADGVQSAHERFPTWNPVLFRERGGRLMLFYKVGPSPGEWWGMVKTSSDGGRSWSAAKRLGDGLIGPVKNKPIQLDDGAILAGSSTENDGWRVHVERSTDGGDTWRVIGPIDTGTGIGAIQPTFLTYPDGRIEMYCRTRSEHGFIARSESLDGGLSWTPLEPTVLPNNNSGLDAVTLRDGRQLLVYNHSTRDQAGMGHKGRGILNVALSRGGAEWEAALVLDYLDAPNRQFSYPSVIQSRDGLVHIVYTWHRQRIKHVVLDPARLEITPMPDGAWPAEGPASLAALRRSRAAPTVSIDDGRFLVDGVPTYQGRYWKGNRVEGLLLNARLVQGIFDDANPETRDLFRYPDTGDWNPDRNTGEFVAAMPVWASYGLNSFTLNMQGGSPTGYGNRNWQNLAYTAAGEPNPAYLSRLTRILDKAAELRMIVILGYFYFGQDQNLEDEHAVIAATDAMTAWLLDSGYRNVIVEVDNECDVHAYDHEILTCSRVDELISRVRQAGRDGRRLLVGTSFGGGAIPTENVVAASDFILLHGNGVDDPATIREMVARTRSLPAYSGQPIVFNEDDHYDFANESNNYKAAIESYAGWGYFDYRRSGETDVRIGFQSVPVDWGVNHARKREFFEYTKEIAGR